MAFPRTLTRIASVALVALGVAVAVGACGASSKKGFTSNDSGADDAGESDGLDGAAPPLTTGDTPCAGLACKVVDCSGEDQPTTLTGKVYDPAGANPLYNVAVYIPGGPEGDADLPEIPEGVQCTTCAGQVLNPMVATTTNEKGEFVLEGVPVDKDVPVVVQVGKWRRKLKFDITQKCAENKVPDREFRLPKNGSEGDMPQIAVTAGGCDALECLLRGIGIDDSEFVPGPSPNGHVHVYNGDGGEFTGAPEAGGDDANPFGGELWNDAEKMAAYDIVMMSCECSENLQNKGGDIGRAGARQAMWDYANMGGRIFATHYHYSWFRYSPQGDWQGLADWTSQGGGSGAYNINTTFPKGQALADWLVTVNASSTPGTIQLTDVTDSLAGVHAPAQSWIEKDENTVRYFSFNAPTDAEEDAQCGRAVYSDLHVSGISSGGQAFPGGCPAPGGLSAQQKALEFMFFDLSGCVSSDSTPPPPVQ